MEGKWGDSAQGGKTNNTAEGSGRTRDRAHALHPAGLHAGATYSGQGTALHTFKMLAESMNEI